MTAQPNSQLSILNSQLLKEYWGYDNFRGIQEDIINSIGEGKDTLGLSDFKLLYPPRNSNRQNLL